MTNPTVTKIIPGAAGKPGIYSVNFDPTTFPTNKDLLKMPTGSLLLQYASLSEACDVACVAGLWQKMCSPDCDTAVFEQIQSSNIVVPLDTVVSSYFDTDVSGGAPGVSVTFDPVATVITNGVGATTYLWERKLTSSPTWLSMSTAANPTVVFPTAGTYDVRVTVTNNGVSNTYTKAAYIAVVTALTGKYISMLGSDAAAGTLAAPWRTFTYAMTQCVPGDTLYVLGDDGIFNSAASADNEWVRWNVPGTVGNPITIKAYPSHNWRMNSFGFTLPDTADTSAGGVYAPYGTKEASNFTGLFEIAADYVVLHDLNVLSSRGIGIKVEGIVGNPVTGARIYNVTANQTYKNSIRCQYFDDLIIDGGDFSEGGYDADFNRPTATLNHPGCVSVKNGTTAVVTNVKSYNQWGEGIIIGDNQDGADVHHCEIYDCMSPLGYINNAENVDLHHNLIYDSATSPFHADPSGGIYINCEYLLAGDINRVTNVRVWNNLVVATGTNFRIGQGELNPTTGLMPPFSGIEAYNNQFVQSRGTAPKGVTIHSGVRVTGTGIKFKYNLTYQTVAGSTVGASSTDPLIEHWPNSWFGVPNASIQGAGDLYVDQLLVAPNAVVTAGAVNVANYQLQGASPAKNVLAALNALVTDDYIGTARTAPYSYGAFE